MSHNIVSGIDHVAAVQGITLWHEAETSAMGAWSTSPWGSLSGWQHTYSPPMRTMTSRTVPLQTVEGTPIASHLATVSPSGGVLGVVTEGYCTLPGRVVLSDLVWALLGAGATLETLGTFDAGASMFASLRVGDAFLVPGDHSDTLPLYDVLTNHTGERSLSGALSLTRLECRNKSMLFAQEHERTTSAVERARRAWVSIRHTANARERLANAASWIADGRARVESERALLSRLAAKLVSRSEVDAFITRYVSIPEDATDRVRNIRQGQRDEFLAVLQDTKDLGEHALGQSGISAYGLLQGVTRFEDWVSQTRGPADVPVSTRRAFRAFLGERQAEKLAARDHVLELAGM